MLNNQLHAFHQVGIRITLCILVTFGSIFGMGEAFAVPETFLIDGANPIQSGATYSCGAMYTSDMQATGAARPYIDLIFNAVTLNSSTNNVAKLINDAKNLETAIKTNASLTGPMNSIRNDINNILTDVGKAEKSYKDKISGKSFGTLSPSCQILSWANNLSSRTNSQYLATYIDGLIKPYREAAISMASGAATTAMNAVYSGTANASQISTGDTTIQNQLTIANGALNSANTMVSVMGANNWIPSSFTGPIPSSDPAYPYIVAPYTFNFSFNFFSGVFWGFPSGIYNGNLGQISITQLQVSSYQQQIINIQNMITYRKTAAAQLATAVANPSDLTKIRAAKTTALTAQTNATNIFSGFQAPSTNMANIPNEIKTSVDGIIALEASANSQYLTTQQTALLAAKNNISSAPADKTGLFETTLTSYQGLQNNPTQADIDAAKALVTTNTAAAVTKYDAMATILKDTVTNLLPSYSTLVFTQPADKTKGAASITGADTLPAAIKTIIDNFNAQTLAAYNTLYGTTVASPPTNFSSLSTAINAVIADNATTVMATIDGFKTTATTALATAISGFNNNVPADITKALADAQKALTDAKAAQTTLKTGVQANIDSVNATITLMSKIVDNIKLISTLNNAQTAAAQDATDATATPAPTLATVLAKANDILTVQKPAAQTALTTLAANGGLSAADMTALNGVMAKIQGSLDKSMYAYVEAQVGAVIASQKSITQPGGFFDLTKVALDKATTSGTNADITAAAATIDMNASPNSPKKDATVTYASILTLLNTIKTDINTYYPGTTTSTAAGTAPSITGGATLPKIAPSNIAVELDILNTSLATAYNIMNPDATSTVVPNFATVTSDINKLAAEKAVIDAITAQKVIAVAATADASIQNVTLAQITAAKQKATQALADANAAYPTTVSSVASDNLKAQVKTLLDAINAEIAQITNLETAAQAAATKAAALDAMNNALKAAENAATVAGTQPYNLTNIASSLTTANKALADATTANGTLLTADQNLQSTKDILSGIQTAIDAIKASQKLANDEAARAAALAAMNKAKIDAGNAATLATTKPYNLTDIATAKTTANKALTDATTANATLSQADQALQSTKDILTAIETSINAILDAEKIATEDAAQVLIMKNSLDAALTALKNSTNAPLDTNIISTAKADAITAQTTAKAAFDKLSSDAKALDANKKILTDIQAAIDVITIASSNAIASNAAVTATKTPLDAAAITAAKADATAAQTAATTAFNKLSPDAQKVQSNIDLMSSIQAALDKINLAEKDAAALAVMNTQSTAVDNAKTDALKPASDLTAITADKNAAIAAQKAATDAFNQLSPASQALDANKKILTDIQAAINVITIAESNAIANNAANVATKTPLDAAAIAAAKADATAAQKAATAAFNKLSPDAQKVQANIDLMSSIQAALDKIIVAEKDAVALAAIGAQMTIVNNSQVEALKPASDLATITTDKNAAIAAQKAATDAFNQLSPASQALDANKKILTDIQAAINIITIAESNAIASNAAITATKIPLDAAAIATAKTQALAAQTAANDAFGKLSPAAQKVQANVDLMSSIQAALDKIIVAEKDAATLAAIGAQITVVTNSQAEALKPASDLATITADKNAAIAAQKAATDAFKLLSPAAQALDANKKLLTDIQAAIDIISTAESNATQVVAIKSNAATANTAMTKATQLPLDAAAIAAAKADATAAQTAAIAAFDKLSPDAQKVQTNLDLMTSIKNALDAIGVAEKDAANLAAIGTQITVVNNSQAEALKPSSDLTTITADKNAAIDAQKLAVAAFNQLSPAAQALDANKKLLTDIQAAIDIISTAESNATQVVAIKSSADAANTAMKKATQLPLDAAAIAAAKADATAAQNAATAAFNKLSPDAQKVQANIDLMTSIKTALDAIAVAEKDAAAIATMGAQLTVVTTSQTEALKTTSDLATITADKKAAIDAQNKAIAAFNQLSLAEQQSKSNTDLMASIQTAIDTITLAESNATQVVAIKSSVSTANAAMTKATQLPLDAAAIAAAKADAIAAQTAATTAFNKLSPDAQKIQANIDLMTSIKTALDAISVAEKDAATLAAIGAQITVVSNSQAEALKPASDLATITADKNAAIDAQKLAIAAFNQLSPAAQALDANKKLLTDIQAAIDIISTAESNATQVVAIKTNAAAATTAMTKATQLPLDAAAIAAAKADATAAQTAAIAAFNKLSPDAQKVQANLDLMTSIKTALDAISVAEKDAATLAAIGAQITVVTNSQAEALKPASDLATITADKNAAIAAQKLAIDAFNQLSPAAQALDANKKLLTDIQAAIDIISTAETNATQLGAIKTNAAVANTAMTKATQLPLDAAAIAAAKADATAAQKAAIAAFNKLSPDAQKIQTNIDLITSIKTALDAIAVAEKDAATLAAIGTQITVVTTSRAEALNPASDLATITADKNAALAAQKLAVDAFNQLSPAAQALDANKKLLTDIQAAIDIISTAESNATQVVTMKTNAAAANAAMTKATQLPLNANAIAAAKADATAAQTAAIAAFNKLSPDAQKVQANLDVMTSIQTALSAIAVAEKDAASLTAIATQITVVTNSQADALKPTSDLATITADKNAAIAAQKLAIDAFNQLSPAAQALDANKKLLTDIQAAIDIISTAESNATQVLAMKTNATVANTAMTKATQLPLNINAITAAKADATAAQTAAIAAFNKLSPDAQKVQANLDVLTSIQTALSAIAVAEKDAGATAVILTNLTVVTNAQADAIKSTLNVAQITADKKAALDAQALAVAAFNQLSPAAQALDANKKKLTDIQAAIDIITAAETQAVKDVANVKVLTDSLTAINLTKNAPIVLPLDANKIAADLQAALAAQTAAQKAFDSLSPAAQALPANQTLLNDIKASINVIKASQAAAVAENNVLNILEAQRVKLAGFETQATTAGATLNNIITLQASGLNEQKVATDAWATVSQTAIKTTADAAKIKLDAIQASLDKIAAAIESALDNFTTGKQGLVRTNLTNSQLPTTTTAINIGLKTDAENQLKASTDTLANTIATIKKPLTAAVKTKVDAAIKTMQDDISKIVIDASIAAAVQVDDYKAKALIEAQKAAASATANPLAATAITTDIPGNLNAVNGQKGYLSLATAALTDLKNTGSKITDIQASISSIQLYVMQIEQSMVSAQLTTALTTPTIANIQKMQTDAGAAQAIANTALAALGSADTAAGNTIKTDMQKMVDQMGILLTLANAQDAISKNVINATTGGGAANFAPTFAIYQTQIQAALDKQKEAKAALSTLNANNQKAPSVIAMMSGMQSDIEKLITAQATMVKNDVTQARFSITITGLNIPNATNGFLEKAKAELTKVNLIPPALPTQQAIDAARTAITNLFGYDVDPTKASSAAAAYNGMLTKQTTLKANITSAFGATVPATIAPLLTDIDKNMAAALAAVDPKSTVPDSFNQYLLSIKTISDNQVAQAAIVAQAIVDAQTAVTNANAAYADFKNLQAQISGLTANSDALLKSMNATTFPEKIVVALGQLALDSKNLPLQLKAAYDKMQTLIAAANDATKKVGTSTAPQTYTDALATLKTLTAVQAPAAVTGADPAIVKNLNTAITNSCNVMNTIWTNTVWNGQKGCLKPGAAVPNNVQWTAPPADMSNQQLTCNYLAYYYNFNGNPPRTPSCTTNITNKSPYKP